MRKSAVLIIMAVPILFLFSGCTRQGEELRLLSEKMDELKQGQESLKKELQDVKKSLRTRPSPTPRRAEFEEALIDIEADPFKGDKLAKVTLMDFSDYE